MLDCMLFYMLQTVPQKNDPQVLDWNVGEKLAVFMYIKQNRKDGASNQVEMTT
jgi:hypothetical protein